MKLKDKTLFLLDMDGTIYLDETVFDGTVEFLDYVRSRGGHCVFLTNNSSRGIDAYMAKMKRLGIPAQAEDFVTSADATIMYLKKTYKDATYYVCGTESLKGMLRSAGLHLAEDASEDVNVVLLGYDTELTYKKLDDCCRLLMRGCDYVATHPDMVCPVSYGFAPDCGSVIQMLKTATGREPVVIGKPKPAMALYAMEKFGASKEQTALMGDRLYTDIACGVNAGITTVLVFSGETTREDLEKSDVKPTFSCQDISVIYDMIR